MEDYKKKYEQALDNFKKIKAANKDNNELVDFIEYEYPELKESGDESIKRCIGMCLTDATEQRFEDFNTTLKDCLAWLEKQGEQKPNKVSIWKHWKNGIGGNGEGINVFLIKRNGTYNVTSCLDHECDYIELSELDKLYVEKQGEQKPTDKVELKFRVGDWIVTPNNETKQIEKVTFGNYYFTDKTLYNIIDTDNKGHLWTIKDAKDGDVLAFDSDTIVIFKDLYNATTFHSYCHIEDGIFTASEEGVPDWWEGKGFYPATKEQRDLLFQKMKEAGYEWDGEKKELKKIVQKPKFYDSMDDLIADALIEEIENSDLADSSKHNRIFWIKSHRQKLTWSKEDEEILDSAISLAYDVEDINMYNWLKSLKERMKGE